MTIRKTGAADGTITQAGVSEVPVAEDSALARTAGAQQPPLWDEADEQALAAEDEDPPLG